MKGRNTCTAPIASPVSVNSRRTGSSTRPRPVSKVFTRPSLRNRMVQANALTTTPTDSGRISASSRVACMIPVDRASTNAVG